MAEKPFRKAVGIDCRYAATQSGIGRYTRELVAHLLKRDDPWQYILFVRDVKHHGLTQLPQKDNFQFSIFNFQFYTFGEQCQFPGTIRHSGISLLHVPHFNAPFFSPFPFLVTIHDLILHRFPNEATLPKRLAYRCLMQNAVRRAAHIIAVSRATADDLAQTYGEETREKTTVTHEGVSPAFRPAPEEEKQRVRTTYQLPPRFALSVGAAKEHKNVQMLIDACPPDLPLILVTGGKEVSRLRPRANTRILSEVPDDDLPALYSCASVLVSPSLLEGFNLPVLEAMACGCRVVATSRGSTPEIAGEYATLVEPTSEALHGALMNLTPKDTAAAMIHARRFSWEKMTDETAAIYSQLLG